MSYIKRLDKAFENAPILPITPNTRYVFFSDCHRGIGNNNDNFLKNQNNYFAALQHYYQYNFCYIEVGDGDELWENTTLSQITEIHGSIFSLLSLFHKSRRLYMLYGNHDMDKKSIDPIFDDFKYYEHQADFLNSVLWKLARFLVRYLWSPLEHLGFSDPTSAAKNNSKKAKLEKRYINYAKNSDCLLLVGHTHKPTLGNNDTPYYNSGSCVHPNAITCIELTGHTISLVKWYTCTQKSEYFRNIYGKYPPSFPVYVKREVIATDNLLVLN